MFNMPTSGPLSPIVSLERRKLEQQGIPPGQEQQGSAAKGAPISGDLAQLIQLNRMIQQQGAMQQQANPAPSTVAQDLMQRAGQQMQPQMQQMAPQPDPRQQGIAQLPQEAVGNGMAAGGIVAFDGGGRVGLTPAEQEEFDKLQRLRLGAYGVPGVAEAQKQTAARYEELRAKKQAAEKAAKTQAEAAETSARSQGILSQYGVGAPTSTPALSSPLAIPGDAYTPPPGKIGAPPVPPEVKQAIAQRVAASGKGQGLKDLVPTLSAPKEEPPSASSLLLAKTKERADKDRAWYENERNKVYEGVGLPAIWKKQQEEQERLKAENSPEARKKAFYNNLAEQLASQIGQRGVSTSSRLAQMVGAYGATRSTTDKETKKLEAELNKAANDLQEKQAIFRANGSFEALKDFEQAQKDYAAAVKESETVKAQARRDEIAEQRYNEDRDLRKEQLAQQGSLGRAQLALGYAELGGRTAQAAATLASRSQAQQVKDRKDAMTWFDNNVGEDEVRKKVAASPQFKKYSKMPVNEKVFQDAVAAEKERMMLDYLASIYQIPKAQPVPHSVMGPVSIAGE